MRHGLRRLVPMNFKKAVSPNRPGTVPKFIMLAPYQLVVNDEYQRDLSESSLIRIRKIAEHWDWGKYKTISVVPCDNVITEDAGTQLYSVIDGQHTAIAAATNGFIEQLPCLLHEPGTVSEQASNFLGINKEKVALTNAAIFNAELAAGKEDAIAINCALSFSKCRLLEAPPSNGVYHEGETLALGTMRIIYRARGEAHLTQVLRVARASGAVPISMFLLKALDIVLTCPECADPAVVENLAQYIAAQGHGRLEIIAKGDTETGERAYVTLANMLISKLYLTRPVKKTKSTYVRTTANN